MKVIDVFRAFSLECYLYEMVVKEIRPIGSVEEAFVLKDRIPDSILVGERHGKMCEGFDFGNSPSTVSAERVVGKIILHTTSEARKAESISLLRTDRRFSRRRIFGCV